jgi:hypothetical protein
MGCGAMANAWVPTIMPPTSNYLNLWLWSWDVPGKRVPESC